MSYIKDFPFYSNGNSLTTLGADDPSVVIGGGPAFGCIAYIQDFPYTRFTFNSIDGPIVEHPFQRDFTMTWVVPGDIYVTDYKYLPLHKSCVGISGSNLWYTPIVHCHQEHRVVSINSVGGGRHRAEFRSGYRINQRPTPLLLYRADPTATLAFIPAWGIGVLVDPSAIPGSLIATYYLMIPGWDFPPIPISDPWSYLDSTSGFSFSSPFSGTITVTF